MGQHKATPAQPLKTADGRVIPMTPGFCLWCQQYVDVGRDIAGSTDPLDPAWHVDGDFGCPSAPDTDDDGTGGHARPYDLARAILRPDTRAARREALESGIAALLAERGDGSGHRQSIVDACLARLDNLVKELDR